MIAPVARLEAQPALDEIGVVTDYLKAIIAHGLLLADSTLPPASTIASACRGEVASVYAACRTLVREGILVEDPFLDTVRVAGNQPSRSLREWYVRYTIRIIMDAGRREGRADGLFDIIRGSVAGVRAALRSMRGECRSYRCRSAMDPKNEGEQGEPARAPS